MNPVTSTPGKKISATTLWICLEVEVYSANSVLRWVQEKQLMFSLPSFLFCGSYSKDQSDIFQTLTCWT
jgi:hypothetical protein